MRAGASFCLCKLLLFEAGADRGRGFVMSGGFGIGDDFDDLPFLINDEGGTARDATIFHQYAVGFGRGAIGEIAQQGERQG